MPVHIANPIPEPKSPINKSQSKKKEVVSTIIEVEEDLEKPTSPKRSDHHIREEGEMNNVSLLDQLTQNKQ